MSLTEEALTDAYERIRGKMGGRAEKRVRGWGSDITSEAFARGWESRARYHDRGGKPDNWLYRIAFCASIDTYNKVSKNEELLECFPESIASEPDLDVNLDLMATLKLIAPKQREVIFRKFFLGQSNGEVGAALGMTPASVNACQYRGLQALRQRLLAKGKVHSSLSMG